MQEAFRREVEARIARIRERCESVRSERTPNLSSSQRDALITVIDLATAALARKKDTEELWDGVVFVERCWMLIHRILSQHEDEHLYGKRLSVAEECLADAYQRARAALSDATNLSPAHPVIVLEPMHSPVIYPRGSSLSEAGFSDRERIDRLPIPVVLCPPGDIHITHNLMWLYHELGHHINREAGLTKRGTRALDGAGLARPGVWRDWCEEILADLVGFSLGGPGLTHQFQVFLEELQGSNRLAEDDCHPPMAMRLQLLLTYASRCGVGAPPGDPVGEHAADIPRVVDALVPVLGLLSELPRRDAEQIVAVKRWYASGKSGSVELPWRLLPSAALLGGEPPEQALSELVRLQPSFDWSLTPQAWEFLRGQVTHMLPTLMAEESGRRFKRPPQELLRIHESISLIGSNNWQLPTSLPEAFAARQRRKWRRIEVFFLCDEMVAAVRREGRTTDDLLAEKRRSLAFLLAELKNMAEESGVYEYREPFVFASFWDCERPNDPRARMHMSPYAWGTDVSRCPGLDFVAAPDGSWPDMLQTHVAGLNHLRAQARRLDREVSP